MEMMCKKLCLKYNIASWYRDAIYRAIDKEYDCDWYFGPATAGIKEMDTSSLKHVKRYKVIGDVKKVFWNVGTLSLLFKKKYQIYFTLIENRCISDWIFFWLAFKFFKNKKYYIWTHGWYGKERGKTAKMKLWLYRNVTGVFVYGNRAKRLLIEQGIPKNKIFVIHNSLDYDIQKELRNNIQPSGIYRNHFKNSQPTIIFIGRLTKVKKLYMVVDALARLRDNGKKYNLVLVGEGSERENLERKVKEFGLQDYVWFFGASYDEKTNAELIYNADLCVSPGNVGLTSIHSLTFGCPVITHDNFEWQMPEYEAIKEGVTGAFFKMDDVEDLKCAITRWFAEKSNKRNDVRNACFDEIDSNWNPYYQMNVIRKNLLF